MKEEAIYLDYHAHAPVDGRVLAALRRAFAECDGNPHSRHRHGEIAREALERARGEVAALVAGTGRDIVFTSGATEANNLAFDGVADLLAERGRKRVLVSGLEHDSVLAAADRLGARGFAVARIPVPPSGVLEAEAVADACEGAGLVSVAAANHEIGVLQPVHAISAAVRSRGALFHSDLSQAAGRIALAADDFDLASLSAHKLGGPAGVGAIHVSRRLRPRLKAAMVGGGQEGGARSGTVPVALCVAFGAACRIAVTEMSAERVRLEVLRDRLLARLLACGGVAVNGTPDRRLAGNINVRIDGVDGEALALCVADRLSISTGSACSARSLEPSHVLLAIGLSPEEAESSVRIGLGRSTTEAEAASAGEILSAAIAALRATRRRSAA